MNMQGVRDSIQIWSCGGLGMLWHIPSPGSWDQGAVRNSYFCTVATRNTTSKYFSCCISHSCKAERPYNFWMTAFPWRKEEPPSLLPPFQASAWCLQRLKLSLLYLKEVTLLMKRRDQNICVSTLNWRELILGLRYLLSYLTLGWLTGGVDLSGGKTQIGKGKKNHYTFPLFRNERWHF